MLYTPIHSVTLPNALFIKHFKTELNTSEEKVQIQGVKKSWQINIQYNSYNKLDTKVDIKNILYCVKPDS